MRTLLNIRTETCLAVVFFQLGLEHMKFNLLSNSIAHLHFQILEH